MRGMRVYFLLIGIAFSSAALADLKVYDVDIRYRQEVFAALSSVIEGVAMLPSGQILVDGSPETLEQVAEVLEAIETRQSEAAPRVTLRYWAVLGSRQATDDDETPEILADVLDELRRVHGDLSFRVIGNATLASESGQASEMQGEPLSVSQQVYVDGSTLNTELDIRFLYRFVTGQFQGANADGSQGNPFQTIRAEQQRVRLNTSMRLGEFVVVGENSIRQDTVGGDMLHGTIFYIVHWSDAE